MGKAKAILRTAARYVISGWTAARGNAMKIASVALRSSMLVVGLVVYLVFIGVFAKGAWVLIAVGWNLF